MSEDSTNSGSSSGSGSTEDTSSTEHAAAPADATPAPMEADSEDAATASAPAAAAAAAGDGDEAGAALAPGAALMHGVAAFVQATLNCVLEPSQVTKAIKKARAVPAWKESVKLANQLLTGKKRRGGASGGSTKRKNPVRSNYAMFVSLASHHVPGAKLGDVAACWRGLPDDIKQDLTARLDAVKEHVKPRVDAGEGIDINAEVAAHEARAKLAPLDYGHLMNTYHADKPDGPTPRGKRAAAAAEDGGAEPGSPGGKKKKKKHGGDGDAPAATPPAAAAAAAAAGPSSKKKGAKQAAATPAGTTAKKGGKSEKKKGRAGHE